MSDAANTPPLDAAARSAAAAAALARRLAKKRGEGTEPAATPGADGARIERRSGEGPAPLSFSQERLWFLDQMGEIGAAYNIPNGIRLEGELRVAPLSRAWNAIAERHDILRTHYGLAAGRAAQWVRPFSPQRLPVLDFSVLESSHSEDAARPAARRVTTTPFSLALGPIYRSVLFRFSPRLHWLAGAVHHIASDGWSSGIWLRELASFYAACRDGRPAPLAPLALQYADYAAWQRSWLAGTRLTEQLTFWRRQLEGVPPLLELPTDRPRPALQRYDGGQASSQFAGHDAVAFTALCARHGATPFMVLLAVWSTLLGRLSGQAHVAIGSPIANRHRYEVEGLIGFFVNTLVFHGDLAGDPSFDEVVTRIREATLAAYSHQDLPFEKLVEELRPERSLSHNPLFQVMLVLQNAGGERPEMSGLSLQPLLLGMTTAAAKVDLELVLVEREGRLIARLVYNRDLYDATTARRLLGTFEALLSSALAGPGERVSRLEWMRPAERHQLVAGWNDTAVVPPAEEVGQTLHGLIERQATLSPDAIALVSGPEQLSYSHTNAAANRLAIELRALGVGLDKLVGIAAERSTELSIGLLAILKAGGAYVPIDPAYPLDRQQLMLEDSGVAVLLTQERLRAGLPSEAVSGLTVLPLDGVAVRGGDMSNGSHAGSPASLAYMIYTSGSTGRPKGAMNTHGGIVNRLRWMQSAYGLGPGDRVLQKTPASFDVSVWELFWPLLSGATLVMAEPRLHGDGAYLARTIATRRITTLHFVPSMLQIFLTEPDLSGCDCLRRVMASGEALPWELTRRFYDRLPGPVELHNLYGPTEAAVDVTYFACRREEPRALVPIGAPVSNTSIRVVDRERRVQPIGVPGEVVIGGVQLARGYHRRPALTAEKFVPDPFATQSGARLYRTGDLGRHLADGQVEYLGRIDHQVKIRGFRIELGEIESVLAAHPKVREVVVLARADFGTTKDRRLVAYLTAVDATLSGDELRLHLRTRVPEHMVPSFFVILEALPLNPSGKVDRRALPPPNIHPGHRAAPAVAPRNGLERQLTAIWSDVLGVSEVGPEQNFFDLGGHSLLLVEVQRRLHGELGVELPILDLFRHPTVRALAAALAGDVAATATDDASDDPAWTARPATGQTAGPLPIAIVGWAGRFPKAPSIAELWRLLLAGQMGIHFFSRQELLEAGVPASTLDRADYVPASGVLADTDLFDAAFFGYSPREAQAMDPQQRLFLECAWEALENAAVDPARAPGRVGVFGGAGLNTYLFNLLSNPEVIEAIGAYQVSIGNKNDSLTTRVSYKLGLTGPSVNVQTACSTSLVAVHLACRALQAGECELALAGGVSVSGNPSVGYRYESGHIASPDGLCRSFDAKAGGTVGGQGVALVVLKPLASALAEGDTIHAVIRGTAINNDGARKVGFTAPSSEGQAGAIVAAQGALDPRSITYVEAHGTATELGDPIEVEALSRAFRRGAARGEKRRAWCALGSIKSNLGHLDAAAGVTGLIKAALALEGEQIPPSLHFERPNPKLALETSPFYVAASLQPWPRGREPRRAGVSSFGIGGTNAHVVLEEAPPIEPGGSSRSWQLLTLSARTPQALEAATDRLAAVLAEPEGVASGDLGLANTAFTLATGRRGFPHRRVLAASSPEDAAKALAARDPKRVVSAKVLASQPEVAFLFPGQGSQYAGMGAELYRLEPAFAAAVDRCVEILRPVLGFDLREVLFPAPERQLEADQRLEQTELTQPALFTLEYATAELWKSVGLEPQAVLGHSIGELVAGQVAGVFSLEAALALVATRGRLMQSLPQGEMLAVELSEDEMRDWLGSELDLAAINGASAVVVAGPSEPVLDLARRLEAGGVGVRRLHTSHMFHSRAMERIVPAFAAEVAKAVPRAPRLPMVSGLTGSWVDAGETQNPDFWAAQLAHPVRFAQGVATLWEGERVLLEVGPGRTLATHARRHPMRGERPVLTSLRHPKDPESDQAFWLTAAGRMWQAGVPLDLGRLWRGERRRRLPLPTYPFERQSFWVKRRGTSQTPGREVPAVSAEVPADSQQVPAVSGEALSTLEQAVARAWRDVLGLNTVGRHDDFFELGGSSLLAVRLAARLSERLGRKIEPHFLLGAPTVASFAAGLGPVDEVSEPSSSPATRPAGCLIDLKKGEAGRIPLFLIHPAGGHVYLFRDLAKALPADQPVFGVRAWGLEEGEVPPASIEDMAARYLEAVLARQPHGPYLLAGSSMGGMVAWEMARRLEATDREVGLLAMFDTFGPGQMPSFSLEEQAARPEPDHPAAKRLHRVQLATTRAMFEYRPKPFAGPLLYFRARKRREGEPLHPEQAWLDLALGESACRLVSGDHASMHEGANARILAEALARRIQSCSRLVGA